MSFIDIVVPDGFECGFQNTLDFESRKYCFKYEYASQGKRCTIVGDDEDVFIKWFHQLPEHQRRLYELIRTTDKVAEYYDIDYKLDEEIDEKMQETMSDETIDMVLEARNEVAQQTLSRKDIIVLSAHTNHKLSLHIISKKTYFTNNQLQNMFARDVHDKLNEKTGGDFTIDTSVYSKNRCFRMYLNHKHGIRNPLILYKPERYSYASFRDTWVVLQDEHLSQRTRIQKYTEEDIHILHHHDVNEVLTEDLEQCLKDFLNQHPYLQAENDPTKNINRINRVDDTTRPCLTDPNDQHSKENMYWYINNNSLYVGCFCKKGQHLCIGKRQGIVPVNVQPEPFTLGTHHITDYQEVHGFKTMFDKRPTGKGKTTSAMKYGEQFRRVLVIHHRLTLDADYIQKYPDYISYQSGIDADKQTVCFNSLSKIDISYYDLIIIDEIRSILKQTEMKDMMYSTHVLFNILENNNIPLIMLDANMTEDDVRFILKHRQDYHPIINHDISPETDKEIYVHHNQDDIILRMKELVDHDKKIVVVYNRSIEFMNSLLSAYTETHRILHINKLTRSSIDMDSSKWYDDYDIIAYSPTISEGVSITDSRFENVHAFGLFTSTSCPAESVSQMIARFRAIRCFRIFLDDKRTRSIPLFYNNQEVYQYVNNNISKLHLITNTQCNFRRSHSQMVMIEDEFSELFCKNMVETSIDYHNYRKTLIQKLVNNGYNIYEDFNTKFSLDECSDNKQDVNDLRAQERNRVNQLIVESPMLNTENLKQLKDKGVETEEEECMIQKYNIVKCTNIYPEYLTTDIADKFRDPDIRRVVRNIKQCFQFMHNQQDQLERVHPSIIIQENAVNIYNSIIEQQHRSFLDQKNLVTHFTTARLEWMNARVSELGFEYLLSPEPITIERFTRNMNHLVDYYSDSQNYDIYRKTQLLFGKPHNRLQQSEITSKYFTSRLYGMFRLVFGIDKEHGLVYQQISLPIQLYDKDSKIPSILGGSNLVHHQDILVQYDTMFMGGRLGSYCPVCNITLKSGTIGFIHVNSRKHKHNLQRQQQEEREENNNPAPSIQSVEVV